MARSFRIINSSMQSVVETDLTRIFDDFPKTAKVESFGTGTQNNTFSYVALVSWDKDAEVQNVNKALRS